VKLDADKVRWHRDRRGWTLEIAAEQAEVALGTVLRAEHGEDIRPSSGRRIARAFGVDISELVPEQPGVVPPKGGAPSTSGLHKAEPPAVPGVISEAEEVGLHADNMDYAQRFLQEIGEYPEHMQGKRVEVEINRDGSVSIHIKPAERKKQTNR